MDAEDKTTKPFAATLQEIAGGKLAGRLADQLQELTRAVTDTGKKGTLALTLTVAPVKKGNTDTLLVTGVTKLVAPEGDDASPSAVFFPDASGNLRRDDPTQLALPLREVTSSRSATA